MRRQVSIIITTVLFTGSLIAAFHEPIAAFFGFLSYQFTSLIIAASNYFLADGEISDQIRRGALGVLSVLSLYALLIKILHRNRPLTILATRLRFRFLSENGENVRIERTQVYRANESRVSAHYLQLHATNGGRVLPIKPKDSYRLPKNLEKHLKDNFTCWGHVSNSWFCIQTFDPALPYSIWARMFVPNWALILLIQFHIVDIDEPGPLFRRFASVRRLISFERDEYTIETPYLEIGAIRYVTRNIWLELNFGKYKIEDIQAHRLASNGLIPIAVHEPNERRKYYSIKISKLSAERAQVRWRNPNPV